MNNWIPKNKILSLAVAIFLMSFFLYFIGLFVVMAKIKNVENVYSGSESEIVLDKKFTVLKLMADTNKESIQTLRDFFVHKDDGISFIKQIENVAKNSGIKFEIASIDIKNNQPNSTKENVEIALKVDGSWGSIMYFINKLEKMSLGVSVIKVSLDTNTQNNWSGLVDFIIFRDK